MGPEGGYVYNCIYKTFTWNRYHSYRRIMTVHVKLNSRNWTLHYKNVDIKKSVVKHVLAQALFDPNENVKLWREKKQLNFESGEIVMSQFIQYIDYSWHCRKNSNRWSQFIVQAWSIKRRKSKAETCSAMPSKNGD